MKLFGLFAATTVSAQKLGRACEKYGWKAVADFSNGHNEDGFETTGQIYFEQNGCGDRVKMWGDLKIGGERDSDHVHGWHVHTLGNVRESCNSAATGGHFNPFGVKGGAFSETAGRTEREVGQIGGISCDVNGDCNLPEREDKLIKLHGARSIVGRSIVIHERADDSVDSEGNKIGSGSRISCAAIVLVKETVIEG